MSVGGPTVSKLAVIRDHSPGSPGALSQSSSRHTSPPSFGGLRLSLGEKAPPASCGGGFIQRAPPSQVLMEARLLCWSLPSTSSRAASIPPQSCFGSRVCPGLGLVQAPGELLWLDVHCFFLFESAQCTVFFLLWLF